MDNVGTIYYGTNASSLAVPDRTTTTISTIESVPAGVYVITGAFDWADGFAEFAMGTLTVGGTTYVTDRQTGAGGGGVNLSFVSFVTANQAIALNAYQATGSEKTAQRVYLRAVRIA